MISKLRWSILSASLMLSGALAGCAATGGNPMADALRPITPTFMLSDHDKAERSLKDPKSLNLAYASFQERVGQPSEARRSYELALRDDPKSVDAILGIARLDQLAERPKEAEAGFKKALKLKPNDPAVLAACGQFYVSQKRWPDAFQYLNAAVLAAPKEPSYKTQLAVAKTKAGDINAGLEMFTALVGPERAHYNVAYILKQTGKSDEAAKQCRLALAINPGFLPAKAMLDQIQSPQGAQVAQATGSGKAPHSIAQTAATAAPGASFPESRSAGARSDGSALTQTSWQSGSRSSAGQSIGGASSATFDNPVFSDAAARSMQSSAATASDPWSPGR